MSKKYICPNQTSACLPCDHAEPHEHSENCDSLVHNGSCGSCVPVNSTKRELKVKIAELEIKNEQQSIKINSLENNIHNHRRVYDEMREENGRLSQRVSNLCRTNVSLKQFCEDNEIIKKTLKDQVNIAENEAHIFEHRIRTLEANKDTGVLHKEIARLNAKISELRQKNNALVEQSEDLARLIRGKDDLIEEANKDTGVLHKEIARLNAKISELRQNNVALVEQVDQLAVRYNKLGEKLEEEKELSDKRLKCIKSLRRQHVYMAKKLNQLKQRNAESDLTKKLEELDALLSKKTGQLAEVMLSEAKLIDSNLEMAKELEKLKGKDIDIDDLLQKENITLTKRVKTLERIIREKNVTIDSLVKERDVLEETSDSHHDTCIKVIKQRDELQRYVRDMSNVLLSNVVTNLENHPNIFIHLKPELDRLIAFLQKES